MDSRSTDVKNAAAAVAAPDPWRTVSGWIWALYLGGLAVLAYVLVV